MTKDENCSNAKEKYPQLTEINYRRTKYILYANKRNMYGKHQLKQKETNYGKTKK